MAKCKQDNKSRLGIQCFLFPCCLSGRALVWTSPPGGSHRRVHGTSSRDQFPSTSPGSTSSSHHAPGLCFPGQLMVGKGKLHSGLRPPVLSASVQCSASVPQCTQDWRGINSNKDSYFPLILVFKGNIACHFDLLLLQLLLLPSVLGQQPLLVKEPPPPPQVYSAFFRSKKYVPSTKNHKNVPLPAVHLRLLCFQGAQC